MNLKRLKMEFKGTKGKWEVLITDEVDSHLDIAINSVNQDCIAWVYSKSSYKDINGKANAKLISKAPILLQAIYDSIEPLKKAGLKEMADYHEKIYLESVNL
jgi:hypothetical protein